MQSSTTTPAFPPRRLHPGAPDNQRARHHCTDHAFAVMALQGQASGPRLFGAAGEAGCDPRHPGKALVVCSVRPPRWRRLLHVCVRAMERRQRSACVRSVGREGSSRRETEEGQEAEEEEREGACEAAGRRRTKYGKEGKNVGDRWRSLTWPDCDRGCADYVTLWASAGAVRSGSRDHSDAQKYLSAYHRVHRPVESLSACGDLDAFQHT